jgi:hypothetical protein
MGRTGRRFVLFFSGKEGSSAIVERLNFHSCITVPIFEHLDQQNATPALDKTTITNALTLVLRSGHWDQNFYKLASTIRSAADLDRCLASIQHVDPDVSVGFKWRPWGDYGDVAEILATNGCRIINLLRRDFVELCASSYFATHVARTIDGIPESVKADGDLQFAFLKLDGAAQAEVRERLYAEPFAADQHKFIAVARRFVASKLHINEYICRMPPGAVKQFYYEDFVANPIEFFAEMLRYIGVHGEDLVSRRGRFLRVSRGDVRRLVSNLDEIVASPVFQTLQKEYTTLAAVG